MGVKESVADPCGAELRTKSLGSAVQAFLGRVRPEFGPDMLADRIPLTLLC
jgi:hypothetical protein